MLLKSRDISRTEVSSQQDWDTLISRMEQEVNFTFFDTDQIFLLADQYQMPIHLVYLLVQRWRGSQTLTLEELQSVSFYAVCRDVLTPYKNKSYLFLKFLNIKYPHLRNTDERLEWYLKMENGLSLTEKVSLLESETSYNSMGIGKKRFEQALQVINLEASHEEIERRRLMEYDGMWALAIASFIDQERGNLTATEVLLVADELANENNTKLKRTIFSYMLSRMGKIEVYFIAQMIKKFHDQISRTSSLVRSFANVFKLDVTMVERLISMHSMVDVAWLVENGKPLVQFERLLPFRTFKPMLAAKWDRKYDFPLVAEAKTDGIRLLVHKLGNQINCYSRRRRSYNYKFPMITDLARVIPTFSVILDGEIMGVQWTVAGPKYANVYELHEALKNPNQNFVFKYVIFDILFMNGVELVKAPYSQRRQIRKQLVDAMKAQKLQLGIDFEEVENIDIYSKEQLIAVYNKFLDYGYEGAIIKSPKGPYEMGKRSLLWRKLKPKETLDVAITGFIPLQGPSGLRVWGIRYAIMREDSFENLGMIRGIEVNAGTKLAELIITQGLMPPSPRMVDLAKDIEHHGRFTQTKESVGIEVEPQIVITIDNLGLFRAGDSFKLRNARFLYIREDKPIEDISTYYDLHDAYFRSKT